MGRLSSHGTRLPLHLHTQSVSWSLHLQDFYGGQFSAIKRQNLLGDGPVGYSGVTLKSYVEFSLHG